MRDYHSRIVDYKYIALRLATEEEHGRGRDHQHQHQHGHQQSGYQKTFLGDALAIFAFNNNAEIIHW